MSTSICWKCFQDEYLQEIVKGNYGPGECSVCGDRDENVISVEELGKLIEPILHEHFKPGPQLKKFGKDDSEWREQAGDSLSSIIENVLGQSFDFDDEIVDAVLDAEDYRPQDGEDAYFDQSVFYVETRIPIAHLFEAWDFALNELKHQRRFFSPSAQVLFEKLFAGIESMTAWNDESARSESVVCEMPAGWELFRGRVCDSPSILNEVFFDPMKHVGPPPADQARSGRMNADGVAVFYGAKEKDTCIAELRPALGGSSVVITVRTSRPLRLLDFTRLEKSHGGSLSFFQPDFNDEVERRAFLRRLHALISRPVVPGREADYLITQTMAEYLAHVYRPGFDGILFSSVQRAGGVNIVLFPRSDPDVPFPLTYVDGSIRLFKTRSIEYEHKEQYVTIDENGDVQVDSDWSDHPYDELWE